MKRGIGKAFVMQFRVPNKDTVLSIFKLVPTDYLRAGRAQYPVQQVSSQWREEELLGANNTQCVSRLH